MFIVPLEIDCKFVHGTVAIDAIVNKSADRAVCARWHFVTKKPTAVRGGAVAVKCSHRMGDGEIFL